MSKLDNYLLGLVDSIRELDEALDLCRSVLESAENLSDYDTASGTQAAFLDERDQLIEEYTNLIERK